MLCSMLTHLYGGELAVDPQAEKHQEEYHGPHLRTVNNISNVSMSYYEIRTTLLHLRDSDDHMMIRSSYRMRIFASICGISQM